MRLKLIGQNRPICRPILGLFTELPQTLSIYPHFLAFFLAPLPSFFPAAFASFVGLYPKILRAFFNSSVIPASAWHPQKDTIRQSTTERNDPLARNESDTDEQCSTERCQQPRPDNPPHYKPKIAPQAKAKESP